MYYMIFGDFSDTQFILFFVTMLVLVLTLILSTVFFAVWIHQQKNIYSAIKYESSTVNICIIDVQRNKITSFNKSNIKNKTTSDLMSFYNRFHPNDVEKVKNWIFSIFVGNEDVEEYLDADVLLSNGRKPCFSLLKLLKYNRTTGLIHLENHLLKYTAPNNAPNLKSRSRHIPVGIVKRSQIAHIINKNKSLRGFTFGIRFFYTKQQVLVNNKIERHMLFTLKNEIYPFASNARAPRQIIDDGENELFLFDLRISDKKDAMHLATSIAHVLRKQMEVNGFVGYISFTIGIVENGQYYQDFDTILENCKETCIIGQTSEQEILMHERNINKITSITQYENEINQLFQRDVLRYYFRPIINVKNGETIGYFEYVKAYNSPFTNFQEMSKYAAKLNRNKDLLSVVCKHVIPKYSMEAHSPGSYLFLTISLLDINFIAEILGQIPAASNTKICFVIDEQEVNENSTNIDIIEEALKNLTASGYRLSLLLKDKNLLLRESIYSLFDYFVVGSSMIGEIRKNNRIRLSAYTLIESLLKYKKPIIATDLESWQSVELIIESGIQYISTDVISPSDDMLLPIEKKKLEKVIQMTEKYN